jgi:hypothetical protein
MKKLSQIVKDNNLIFDVVNVILGIGLLVAIVLFILMPGNMVAFAFLCWMAGIMNVSNGIKQYRDKKKRTFAMCLIMVGMIILIGGIYLLKIIFI